MLMFPSEPGNLAEGGGEQVGGGGSHKGRPLVHGQEYGRHKTGEPQFSSSSKR